MKFLTTASLSLMIGFLFAIIIGLILIPRLKYQRLSIYLQERHKSKKNTPTMGGLIFISSTLITIILLIIFKKFLISNHLLIVIITFVGYGLIGFLDDYLIIKKNNNKGLSEKTKLGLQIIIAIIFFYLFIKSGNEPLLWIHSINLKLSIGSLYGLFILFVLVAGSNAVNITDGLDGLATGLSIIAFLTFGIISYNTGWLEGYFSIGTFCFILSGSLIGFLFFNSNPAKIFMGDTGSLALGATLGSIAILTRHEILLVLIGIVFVIETLSCIIQRIYYKLTHKRIFPMTPIHHTFEKRGMKENDIVKLFWVIGFIASLLALCYGVWL